MGNREDLLEGARKAILERGIAKVTARDIAAQAGVSLAAIGYHFGSKDKLVNQAIMEATGSRIGDGLEAAIIESGQDHTLAESLAGTWQGMLDIAVDAHEELLLSLENGVQIAHNPEAQEFMSGATATAFADLAGSVQRAHPELPDDLALSIAKFYFLLFQGVAMQILLAPDTEFPDGAEIQRVLAALTGGDASR
ncbi:TetR/AcrR family transcriptional regulator [Nocardia stercoris]|uniref:TetR/AcrR family transcriptional regulator n=1 Tax=Nocardia stercoris TaxID=2483361 RepID=A0A3M2LC85_9NOCA|nr:TetR/AcrR family transcriptional regulator [Nocardia stercoris]RMI34320.1 TetR/AcrR family transcriptional regulator [Nocardia stercoris]